MLGAASTTIGETLRVCWQTSLSPGHELSCQRKPLGGHAVLNHQFSDSVQVLVKRVSAHHAEQPRQQLGVLSDQSPHICAHGERYRGGFLVRRALDGSRGAFYEVESLL